MGIDDIMDAAREALAFESRLDGVTVEEVLEAAVATALFKYNRMVRAEVFARVVELAETIDADMDDDLAGDGPAALLWFARELEGDIPAEDRPGFG